MRGQIILALLFPQYYVSGNPPVRLCLFAGWGGISALLSWRTRSFKLLVLGARGHVWCPFFTSSDSENPILGNQILRTIPCSPLGATPILIGPQPF